MIRVGAGGKIAVEALARPLGAARVDLAAIEARALVRIGEEIVGRRHLLELLLGLLVAGVEVGMQLLRQLPIGLANVVGRGGLLDAQRLVGIFQAVLLASRARPG